MSIDRKALLAAHEIAGHCTVSDGVRGIQADADGYMVLCDPPLTESQFVSQMIAGSLAELILTHGEAVALLKLRANKSVLAVCTQISGNRRAAVHAGGNNGSAAQRQACGANGGTPKTNRDKCGDTQKEHHEGGGQSKSEGATKTRCSYGPGRGNRCWRLL